MKIRIRDTIKIYWREVRRYKLLVLFMFVALGIASVLELIIPIYYKEFFNILTSTVPNSNTVTLLIRILIIIATINGGSWILYRFTTFGNNYLEPRVMTDLSQEAYDYLQRHSYGFFTNRFVGALVRKVTRMTRAFEDLFDRMYWNLFPLAIRIIGAILVLYFANHIIAYILLAWTVFFITFNYIFVKWKLKYDEARALKDTEATAVLADAVTNQNNIQLFNGYGFEFARIKKVTEELRHLRTFTWNLGAIVEAVQAALFIAVEFLLMYFAIRFWQAGRLTLGDFVLIQSYLMMLIGRLWDIGRHMRDMYESFADAE